MKLYMTLLLAGLSFSFSAGTSSSLLDTVLNGLNKNGEMYNAVQSARVVYSFIGMYKSMIKFSPLFKEIMDDLGNKNPKYKVDLDIAAGHVPTITDLYQLVKARNAQVAFTSVLANNKHFQELTSLMNKTDLEHSKDDVERLIYLITGHNVELKPGLFEDSTSDKEKITKSRDDKSRNLVIAVLFLHDIWSPLMDDLMLSTTGTTASNSAMLQIASTFNYARLNQISGLPLDGQKYSVGGQGTGGIDPEVSQIIRLHKAVKATIGQKAKVAPYDGLVLQGQLMGKVLDICNRALQQALSDMPNIVG